MKIRSTPTPKGTTPRKMTKANKNTLEVMK